MLQDSFAELHLIAFHPLQNIFWIPTGMLSEENQSEYVDFDDLDLDWNHVVELTTVLKSGVGSS